VPLTTATGPDPVLRFQQETGLSVWQWSHTPCSLPGPDDISIQTFNLIFPAFTMSSGSISRLFEERINVLDYPSSVIAMLYACTVRMRIHAPDEARSWLRPESVTSPGPRHDRRHRRPIGLCITGAERRVLVEAPADQRRASDQGVYLRRGLLENVIAHASLKWRGSGSGYFEIFSSYNKYLSRTSPDWSHRFRFPSLF
jgi:hypothetical protein